jgi:hypothetical protein
VPSQSSEKVVCEPFEQARIRNRLNSKYFFIAALILLSQREMDSLFYEDILDETQVNIDAREL